MNARSYPDAMTLAEARALFFARSGLGDDGGYNGRWGRVEEIGQLALYLCSEEAGFMTGTDIRIDGGWTAQ